MSANKLYATSTLVFILSITLLLYSGCVKKTNGQLMGSAVKETNEVVAENGEKTTDAAGTVAEGVGRSIDKQLDKNSGNIFNAAARTAIRATETLVTTIDDYEDSKRLEYDIMTVLEADLPDDITIDFIGKSKALLTKSFDIYYNMPNGSQYWGTYKAYDKDEKLIASWDDMLVWRSPDDRRSFSRFTFALPNEREYSRVKNFKIKLRKAQ